MLTRKQCLPLGDASRCGETGWNLNVFGRPTRMKLVKATIKNKAATVCKNLSKVRTGTMVGRCFRHYQFGQIVRSNVLAHLAKKM